MNISNREKTKLLDIKKCYDETGTISGVVKKLGLQDWRVKKALRKGHWLGLFVYDKYYKKHTEKIKYIKSIVEKDKKCKLTKQEMQQIRYVFSHSYQNNISPIIMRGILVKILGINTINKITSNISLPNKKTQRFRRKLFEQIINLLKKGEKADAICCSLKISNNQFKIILRKAKEKKLIETDNIPSLKRRIHFDKKLFKKIKMYLKRNYKVREICENLKIKPLIFKNILLAAKEKKLIKTTRIKSLQRIRFDRNIFKKLQEHVKKGCKQTEIYKGLKLSNKQLTEILKKARQKKLTNAKSFKEFRKELSPIPNQERILKAMKLYYSFGSLLEVSKRMNITRERVRQLLKAGERNKLFKYELYRVAYIKNVSKQISKTEVEKELVSYGNLNNLIKKYTLPTWASEKLLNFYNIDANYIKKVKRDTNDSKIYNEIVETLGHHPTTTEMRKNSRWRALWVRLAYRYKGFDNFRRAYGIPIPKKGYSKFKEVAVPRAIEAARKRAIKRSKERQDSILELLYNNKQPLCQTEISKALNINHNVVTKYISPLIKEGKVSMKMEHPKKLYFLSTSNAQQQPDIYTNTEKVEENRNISKEGT